MGKNVHMAPDDSSPDVLSSLPRSRPQRRSTKRDAGRAKASGAGAEAPAGTTSKRTGAGKAKTAAKPRAATRAKAAAKPKTTAKPRATAKPRRAAPPKARASGEVRIPPAGFAPPREDTGRSAPSGTELVGTVVQAAGELAQIGAAVGGQALKSVLGRLGRDR